MLDTAAPVRHKSHEVDVDLGSAANILVVDDNPINRKKLRLAVKKLGLVADVAKDGAQALEALRERPYDAVLLDIVMPEMDGFDVLDALKSNPQLRDIPVIVVSALDDQTESVVRAIELGAEDFLPKDFDPILLKARLSTSLTKKKFRDQELEYYQRVAQLTTAAEVLESGRFSPQNLEIDELAERPDPLGRLAAVFRGMAQEIYERELRLKRTVQLLQGSFLVIAVGLVWGLTPALSRMTSGIGSNPLGLAIWANGIAAVFCFSIAAYRRKLPRLKMHEWLFFIYWAVLAGILQRLTTYWVAAHVEASMLSLIVTLQGFMVFGFAAFTKLEKATPRRLFGLTVGLVGVGILLSTRFDVANAAQNTWLLLALLLPLLFAIEAIVLAGRRPVRIDTFASVGIMMALSALMLAPVAYATGDFLSLGPTIGRMEILVALIGLVGASSLLLAFHLIATAGAVFYSQSAYAMTLAGIVWGMLLLDEQLSFMAWIAFAVILVGMYLVEPKPSDDEVVINRSFAKSSGSGSHH
ncbi:MAG: response regulator [Rhodothermales bacterium]|nr:response regulator [Rhodothermales bacterium]